MITKRQREIVTAVAEAMGENGGLYCHRLVSYPNVVKAAGDLKGPARLVDSILRRVGRKLGLPPDAGLGEIVHEAVYQEGIEMPIDMPRSIRPKLSCGEQLLLEALAKALIPKGGNYSGYRSDVANSTGKSESQVETGVAVLEHKFGSVNIEQALVTAFATGLLSPAESFGKELPKPLQTIKDSDSYKKATEHIFTMYVRTLTHAEEETVIEFMRRTGLNGGLYWAGWDNVVAALTEKNPFIIQETLLRLNQKYGQTRKGNMFYAISSDLSVPITAEIPPRTGAEFSNLELRVMLHAAEVLLPSAGYYHGHIKELSARAGISVRSLWQINSGIFKKTGTDNLGQAVTYFIAHDLTPVSSLSREARQSPALENILMHSRQVNHLDRKYPSLSVWR